MLYCSKHVDIICNQMNLSLLFYSRLGVCVNCDTKFPTCIVTGRPLLDYQFWMCSTCKHRAYENDIRTMSTCPLCHAEIWTCYHVGWRCREHLIYNEFWWRYLLSCWAKYQGPKLTLWLQALLDELQKKILQ